MNRSPIEISTVQFADETITELLALYRGPAVSFASLQLVHVLHRLVPHVNELNSYHAVIDIIVAKNI